VQIRNINKLSKLNELKKSILADGVIDEAEVKQLREVLYADGKIDKEEAEFLFELNDAVSGKANHSSWETLFVRAITSFLLDNKIPQGEINDEDALWLLNKILKDGLLDKTEKALLNNLKGMAKNSPKVLDLK
jgi:hypothetical protein